MKNWREFRLPSRNKSSDNVWMICQDDEFIYTKHGMLGGAMQEFSDRPGDKGKPGTLAYVNAHDNAKFNLEREVRKKIEHGYVEYINGKPTEEFQSEITFDKFLPKNFCNYKPQTSIDQSALIKLHKSGKARYTRKYDGQCHLLVHHTWGWEIYTRRIDLATDRFPKQKQELESTSFGVGTIIVAEAVCSNNGKDDFKAISRICRSDPEESRKLIDSNQVSEPRFVIFDILWKDGVDLRNSKYDERSFSWRDGWCNHNSKSSLIVPVEYFNLTPDTWESSCKDFGYEGFVVTDGDSVPGDKFYSFDGDAKRPKGHYKLKPTYTEDCVIFAALTGTGKRMHTIGSVYVKQKHPDTGAWFSCGKVGSGFTEEDLNSIEIICKNSNVPIFNKDKEVDSLDLSEDNNFPVIEIEFSERQPGTQKFRFPVFLRVRDDKSSRECIAQKLYDE